MSHTISHPRERIIYTQKMIGAWDWKREYSCAHGTRCWRAQASPGPSPSSTWNANFEECFQCHRTQCSKQPQTSSTMTWSSSNWRINFWTMKIHVQQEDATRLRLPKTVQLAASVTCMSSLRKRRHQIETRSSKMHLVYENRRKLSNSMIMWKKGAKTAVAVKRERKMHNLQMQLKRLFMFVARAPLLQQPI